MVEKREEKETVVVHDRDHNEPRSANAMTWVLIAVIVIVLLFLLFGGMSLLNGGNNNTTTTPSVPSSGVQAPSTGGGQ